MICTQRNTVIIIFLVIVLSVGKHTWFLHARSSDLKDIRSVLEPIREKYNLPAIAAAVIINGHIVASDAAGLRKVGSDVKVSYDDKFHLGSCTKAMTATMIGMLVERSRLQWDTTLAEALPELAGDMHPDYKNVTLKHLLAHRAGLPPSDKSWPKGKSFMDMYNLPGLPMQQRLAYAKMMLSRKPWAIPGTKYIYSNAGYAILGVIAEQTMNTPWETMMKEMLFDPLGITTAGFGAMGLPGKIDQPWQHKLIGGKLKPIEPGPVSDNPPVIAPAGTVHCSVGDWAKFVACHLKGARNGKTLLMPETFRVLHTPAFDGNYMGGWNITERDWAGGRVLTHTGSNGMNFAVVWMAPKRNFAVLVVSNQGKGEVAKGCDEAAWTLIKKFLLNDKGGKGR
ncbi:MAG: beta-lactamase family protein [Sedimentisphaerales bacterium]|nr:beta-lactamase family protein [Sedimentisphaerales bacterium]